MTSARFGSGLEPVVTAGRVLDLPGGSALHECATSSTADHDFNPVVPGRRRIGFNARPRPLGDTIVSKPRTAARIAISTLDAASYRVRLIDPDGRIGSEIPLLSVDVAGALREVCFHSPDRSAFELWRGERLILKAFRMERDRQISVRPDTQDGPHRGLSGSH